MESNRSCQDTVKWNKRLNAQILVCNQHWIAYNQFIITKSKYLIILLSFGAIRFLFVTDVCAILGIYLERYGRKREENQWDKLILHMNYTKVEKIGVNYITCKPHGWPGKQLL